MTAPDDLLLFAPVSPDRRRLVAAFLGYDEPDAALWEVRDLVDGLGAVPLAAAATWAPDQRGCVEVVRLLTAPGKRRRGHATALLHGVADAVRARGGGALRALVRPDDVPVLLLLQECGFAAVHVAARQDGQRLLCLEQWL